MAVIETMEASGGRHLRLNCAGAGGVNLYVDRADGHLDCASGVSFRGKEQVPNRVMRCLMGPGLGRCLSWRGVPRGVERRVPVRGRRGE